MSGRRPVFAGRFAAEKAMGLLTARLIALSYPEAVEQTAREVADGADSPEMDRVFAIYMLRYLAEGGRKSCEDTLVRLSSSKDPGVARAALLQLSQVDRSGAYRDLYIAFARRGEEAGLEAISKWADPGISVFVHQMVEQEEASARTGGGLLYHASKAALKKCEILMSPDWQLLLQRQIESPSAEPAHRAEWAIDVARARSLNGLTDWLRDRIDAGLRRGDSSNPSFREQYVGADNPVGLGDMWHDQALVAYAESGGLLTDLDRGRLNHLGYLGDPKARMEERLSKEK